MNRFVTTAATLAITLAIATPASAQLLGGGGLGGGLGGSLGGAIGVGGGLPIGSVSGVGDVGVSGAVDGATRHARNHGRVVPSADGIVRTRVVAIPPVDARFVPAVPRLRTVTSVVRVPAIPDVELRRSAIVDAGIPPVAYVDVPTYVDRQYVVLQDELRGTGVQVERRGEQIVLEMPSDVTFSFNKYNIQPRFYGTLNAVSRTLARYPATYVDVNGHTDAIGSLDYNQVLSERRADSVADYLAVRQVNPARLHVQGFGKTEPVASNATIAGRAANRRVEIILTPYAA